MINTLTELAKKHGTDKASGEHQYTKTYDTLFQDKRQKIKKVLEIGIHKGGSLRMWAEYFPFAKIFGIDVVENKLIQEGNIQSFLADQGNDIQLAEVIQKIGDDIDLIIDDGSHEPADQKTSLDMFWPCLKIGGLYVIEDMPVSGKEGMLIFHK